MCTISGIVSVFMYKNIVGDGKWIFSPSSFVLRSLLFAHFHFLLSLVNSPPSFNGCRCKAPKAPPFPPHILPKNKNDAFFPPNELSRITRVSYEFKQGAISTSSRHTFFGRATHLSVSFVVRILRRPTTTYYDLQLQLLLLVYLVYPVPTKNSTKNRRLL